MFDFEAKIKNNEKYNLTQLINECKKKIQEDLQEPILIGIKNENYKLYVKIMEEKYPYFANRYPFVFDKLIENPQDLEFLDLLLKKIEGLNKDNFERETQNVVDLVAEKRQNKNK